MVLAGRSFRLGLITAQVLHVTRGDDEAYEQGLSQPALAMLVRRGRLEREAHGVYRIPEVCCTSREVTR